MSRWASFEKYCLQVTPILEAISHNGLGIDPLAQSEFFGILTTERDSIYSTIQGKIPLHVFKVKSWKRKPKEVDAEGYATVTIGHKDEEKITARVKLVAEPEGGMWARLPFNPRAWPQVQDLARALGANLPKKQDAEDDSDTSTDDKALKKVAKKYPVFEDIRQYRKRDKLINTYNFTLDKENRIHSQFGFHPSTWRKSSRQPNIQNIPKRGDLAKAFRKMIVPRPGHILIEGDSAAIEAVLVGWLAGSPRYIRLARAGVHGWLTSALHGEYIDIGLPDQDLTTACQSAKTRWPDDYEKCKRVVHLSNYCGTPRRIADEYPDEFPTEREAGRLQSFYFGTEAGQDIKRWQQQTIDIAHANKGLEGHFGLRHRFYSLYSWDRRKREQVESLWNYHLAHPHEVLKEADNALILRITARIAAGRSLKEALNAESYVLGEDAKRAVAFVPQSDASFVQSDILLRLVAADPRFLDWIVALVHDSIICDCPLVHADHCAGLLYREMVRPLPQLDGLWIGAELKRGYNLRDMEVIHATPAAASPLPSGLPN